MPPLALLADTAADLMTPDPVSLPATTTAAAATAFVTDRGIGSAVVIDAAGHPLGVVTKTDLLVHTREHGQPDTPVNSIMTPAVFSVRADAPARSVVGQLLGLNVHHLFVTDHAGVVVGVITPLDVLRKLG